MSDHPYKTAPLSKKYPDEVDVRIPRKSAGLERRIKKDGTLHIVGGAPDRMVFNPKMIVRDLEGTGLSDVHYTMHTPDGDVTYKLIGFEYIGDDEDGNPKFNFGSWIMDRVDADKGSAE